MMTRQGIIWTTLMAIACMGVHSAAMKVAAHGQADQRPMRPPPRSGHMGLAANGRLFVAGGYAIAGGMQSRLDAWNPADQSWTAFSPMPRPRGLGAMVVLGDRLYVIGGIGADNQPAPDIDVFNLKTEKWESSIVHDALPSRVAAVALGDDIVIIGGIDAKTGGADGVHSRRVDSFTPRTGQWKRRADLHIGRHGHAAAALDGRIYVCGGYALHGENDSNQTRSVEVYDPAADRWTDGPTLQRPHAFHGVVAMNGKLLAFGTRGDDRRLEVFDPAAERWSDGPPMPLPRHRFACGVLDDRLYVLDGEDEHGDTPATMLAFDGRTHAWSILEGSGSATRPSR